MKLDPGFLSHWKTELLIDRLGAEGVLAVLRLWGDCQIKRQYSGLELNAKRLAMKTKWKGDANQLWETLTDEDAPWLDPEEGGTWEVHGFAEQQKQVVHLWQASKKGGRPKKDSSSSTSSSSSPISEPNGNQMVLVAENEGENATSDDALDAFWKAYPQKGRERSRSRANVKKAWSKIKPSERPSESILMAALADWKKSEHWAEGYVPGAQRFISERMWEDAPKPARTLGQGFASGKPKPPTEPEDGLEGDEALQFLKDLEAKSA